MADKTIITFGPKTSDTLLSIAQRQGVNVRQERAAGQWTRIMFAKITGDWEHDSSDHAYHASACLVKWNGTTQSFEEDENLKISKLYDPLSGTEQPSHAVNDIVSIAYTGMYVIVGSPAGGKLPINVILQETLIEGRTATAVYADSPTKPISGVVYAPSLGLQAVPKDTRCLVTEVDHPDDISNVTVSDVTVYQLIYAHASSPKPTLIMPSVSGNRLISNLIDTANTRMMVTLPGETSATQKTSPYTYPTTYPGIIEAYNDNTTSSDIYNRSPVGRFPVDMTEAQARAAVTVALTADTENVNYYRCTLTRASGYEGYVLEYRITSSGTWTSYTSPFPVLKTQTTTAYPLQIRLKKSYAPFAYTSPSYTLLWPAPS